MYYFWLGRDCEPKAPRDNIEMLHYLRDLALAVK